MFAGMHTRAVQSVMSFSGMLSRQLRRYAAAPPIDDDMNTQGRGAAIASAIAWAFVKAPKCMSSTKMFPDYRACPGSSAAFL